MSNFDQPDETLPPAAGRASALPAGPATPRAAVRQPPSRGGGTLVLALLLSLIALAAAGYVGWQQWQQARRLSLDSRNVGSMQQRVAALETRLAATDSARVSLDQRLSDAAAVNRSMREELLGQAERTRSLEDAVARLAENNLSGQDKMRLDETESLLRMAGERYTLFHDAQGAADAYALADQALAAVNDAAFAGVRQDIATERAALMKSQPMSQAQALRRLSGLRSALATLPLKPLDRPAAAASNAGSSRIAHVLAGVISIQRDSGAPLAVADARFARELAALDLAQAQAALLAFDGNAYAAALQRVELALSSQFDTGAPAVQQARSELASLAAALPSGPPLALGGALAELRNLRAVHALKPDAAAASPAAAASVAGGKRP